MRRRSSWQVLLPTFVAAVACVWSIPTLIMAAVYLTLGAMTVGYRSLESFPNIGLPVSWRRGYRAAFVYFYHFMWWPWYVRGSWIPPAKRLLETALTRLHVK